MNFRLMQNLVVALCLVSAFSAKAGLPEAKTFMTDLVQLAQKSKAQEGKADSQSDAQVKALSDRVDFAALAKKSLGARWAKTPLGERNDFLKTLQELLESVVYPNAKKIAVKPEDLDYKIAPKNPNQVNVIGHVTREKNGEMVNQSLEVGLIYDPKTQKITDAVIEGEVLSQNLKRQFTEALKKKTFAQIIEKMKKRVNEARNPKS